MPLAERDLEQGREGAVDVRRVAEVELPRDDDRKG